MRLSFLPGILPCLPSPSACWGRGAGGEGAELLHAFVDCVLDQRPHTRWISRHLVSRDAKHGVSSFDQILVATFISLTTLFGLMVFPVNLDDQLQCDTAKVGRVGRNWEFAAKLLVPTSSIADDLPYGIGKFVSPSALVARECDCIRFRAEIVGLSASACA